ncbi:MAG: hypothetical protein A3H98_12075 [Bacteroidetes bacterium RIFCSPLOWO2_02_FULL_36_8]|nr:MAG: hypothetical protein A3H98_12075 [Bacteroidetes bacterium RIFCSPLOWO2_02_FULL_36_8]OFY71280.1 MAG: hypothetical protein A3G23_02080 [Bacteroidetes bacterium RIFCSPLOWO2_12_FULL_37_12]
MKKSLFIYFIFLFLSDSCQNGSHRNSGYSIKGTVHGGPREEIYLWEYQCGAIKKIDSARIENSQFHLSSNKPLTKGFYRIGFNYRTFGDIILSDESIKFTTDYDHFGENMVIENSKENEIYFGFLKKKKMILGKINDLREKAANLTLGGGTPDQREMTRLENEFSLLETEQINLLQQTGAENPESFMAIVAQVAKVPNRMANPETGKNYSNDADFLHDHYFDLIDFSKEEIIRGPMLEEKYFTYLKLYAEQTKEGHWKGLELIMEKTSVNTVVFQATMNYLLSAFENYQPTDLFIRLAEKYVSAFPNDSRTPGLTLRIKDEKKLETGGMAPELALNNPNGKSLKLSALRGKIVLIDFWASWCKPCRVENPNVVRLYSKFKNHGFEIYSISLDVEKDRWVAAISDDQMKWENHVSDLNGWNSQAAVLYNVKGIPHTILLDREGKIIEKNLHGEELEKKLEEILGVMPVN